MKYVAAGVPPSVTKVEPAMSIIDPRKNSRKPNVATVSFIFRSPRTVTKIVRIKELPTKPRRATRSTKS